jgi:DNA-binding transcriptional regulator YiaG
MDDKRFVGTVRKAMGVSQTALAAELGVSPAAVCRWESGDRPLSKPIRTLLEQLAAKAARRART